MIHCCHGHVTTLDNDHFARSADRGAIAARLVFGADDDHSAHILQQFLDAGFREVEWRYGFEEWQNKELWREMGSVCPVCFALDGQRFKINWLLQNMKHNAPKYSLSHVNCGCQLFRVNRTEEMLDYSEEVDVAPSEISEELRQGPFDLDQVPEDQRDTMGLPPEVNEWTDIKWVWDSVRGEFVPLQTALDSGNVPWIYDAMTGEFVSQEEYTNRYGPWGNV